MNKMQKFLGSEDNCELHLYLWFQIHKTLGIFMLQKDSPRLRGVPFYNQFHGWNLNTYNLNKINWIDGSSGHLERILFLQSVQSVLFSCNNLHPIKQGSQTKSSFMLAFYYIQSQVNNEFIGYHNKILQWCLGVLLQLSVLSFLFPVPASI